MHVNRRLSGFGTLLLAGAIMLPVSGKHGQSSKFTHFTGTQTIVGVATYGELTYSDPTFTDPDTYLKRIRGMLRLTVEDCDDERMTGTSEVGVNANLKRDGLGRYWGKFTSTRTDGDGGLERIVRGL